MLIILSPKRVTGFEPAIFSLARRHSTTELHPLRKRNLLLSYKKYYSRIYNNVNCAACIKQYRRQLPRLTILFCQALGFLRLHRPKIKFYR